MARIGSLTVNVSGSKEKMVWVDLEMSGLDVDKERILQIAVCITDHELNNMVEVSNREWGWVKRASG